MSSENLLETDVDAHSGEKTLVGTSPVSNLNDDCLRYIFANLGIIDRIRIQRVCKRWQAVGILPWTDLKRLVISKKENSFCYNIEIIRKVLKFCGSSLKDFHNTCFLDGMFLFVELLVTLNELCPNIRSLKTPNMEYTENSIAYLNSHFTELNEISIGWCHKGLDGWFQKFFSQSQHLHTVEINGRTFDSSYLRTLNGEIIQSLTLTSTGNIAPGDFKSVVPQLSKLNTLIVNDEDYQLLQDLNEILGLFPNPGNFKKLVFCSARLSSRHFNCTKLNNLQYFTGLRSLKLCCSTITLDDSLLDTIANCCEELTDVCIGMSRFISDLGIHKIATLPKLEYFSLICLPLITNEAFGNMPELKTLECFDCKNLSAYGFEQVLQTSEKLESLKVTNCYGVNNKDLIDSAKRTALNRLQNVNLELRFGSNGGKHFSAEQYAPNSRGAKLKVIFEESDYYVYYSDDDDNSIIDDGYCYFDDDDDDWY